MTSITGTIEALTGDEAIRVLADTADYQNRPPDPTELRAYSTGSATITLFCRAGIISITPRSADAISRRATSSAGPRMEPTAVRWPT